MSHCFQIIRDGKPVTLSIIDEELCAAIGEAVHPEKWCANWYNIEGFGFATGMTINELRVCWPERSVIHDFFAKPEFTIDTWRD